MELLSQRGGQAGTPASPQQLRTLSASREARAASMGAHGPPLTSWVVLSKSVSLSVFSFLRCG